MPSQTHDVVVQTYLFMFVVTYIQECKHHSILVYLFKLRVQVGTSGSVLVFLHTGVPSYLRTCSV